MKEQKYRAWHKTEQKMYQVRGIMWGDVIDLVRIDLDTSKNGIQMTDVVWLNLDEVELMQFTGLKDRSGQPIYEGDIVRHEEMRAKGIVTWEENFARYTVETADTEMSYALYGEWEIIGNIYENSDLLPHTNR